MHADSRIDDLERRLSQYHEQLSEAVVQRDRLAIDAAWGVHGAFYSTLGVLLALYLFNRYVGWNWWPAQIALGLVIVAIEVGIRMWSNAARMKEVETFARLPEWRWIER